MFSKIFVARQDLAVVRVEHYRHTINKTKVFTLLKLIKNHYLPCSSVTDIFINIVNVRSHG